MAFLPHPVACKIIYRTGSAQFRCTAVAMNGHRSAMEDAHMIDVSDDYACVGVFDGHAGAGCAKYCCKKFPPLLRKAAKPIPPDTLRSLCQRVDDAFLDGLPNDNAGTTGTFAVVTPLDGGVFLTQVVNVGDSRTLIMRNGEVVLATEDHKPTLPRERKRLREAGAVVDQGLGYVMNDDGDKGLALTRAFGDRDFKRRRGRPDIVTCIPDCLQFECRAGDQVFLACDGVYDVASSSAVASFVAGRLEQGRDSATTLKDLLDHCLTRNSTDNMSAVLLEFLDGRDHRPSREWVSGLYLPFNLAFHTAYQAAALAAGLSLPKALRARAAVLRESPTTPATPTPSRSGNGPQLDGLERRLLCGPSEGGPDPDAWFAALARHLEALLKERRAAVTKTVNDALDAMTREQSAPTLSAAPAPVAIPVNGTKKVAHTDHATECSHRTGPIAPLRRPPALDMDWGSQRKRRRLRIPEWVAMPKSTLDTK